MRRHKAMCGVYMSSRRTDERDIEKSIALSSTYASSKYSNALTATYLSEIKLWSGSGEAVASQQYDALGLTRNESWSVCVYIVYIHICDGACFKFRVDSCIWNTFSYNFPDVFSQRRLSKFSI